MNEDNDDSSLDGLISQLSQLRPLMNETEFVNRFASALQIEDNLALFFLQAANFNLELAVNLYLDTRPPNIQIDSPPIDANEEVNIDFTPSEPSNTPREQGSQDVTFQSGNISSNDEEMGGA